MGECGDRRDVHRFLADGPHQRGRYIAGLPLNIDTRELGVRDFSRFSEPAPSGSGLTMCHLAGKIQQVTDPTGAVADQPVPAARQGRIRRVTSGRRCPFRRRLRAPQLQRRAGKLMKCADSTGRQRPGKSNSPMGSLNSPKLPLTYHLLQTRFPVSSVVKTPC